MTRTDQRNRSNSSETARYGTWIRTNRIVTFAAASLVCLAATAIVGWPWMILIASVALPLGYITVVISLTAWRFSARGGGVQHRVHSLLASTVAPLAGEEILDVGCGSGALVVTMARIQPEARITGVDAWGSDWQYSQRQAETNARIEGVDRNVTFAPHSAGQLPYRAAFDALVSCLTFHEVRNAASPTEVLIASIDVLRPGGRFILLDLFGSTTHYPSVQAVIDAIEQSGATVETATPLGELIRLPFPLAMQQALGGAVIIIGTRSRLTQLQASPHGRRS